MLSPASVLWLLSNTQRFDDVVFDLQCLYLIFTDPQTDVGFWNGFKVLKYEATEGFGANGWQVPAQRSIDIT